MKSSNIVTLVDEFTIEAQTYIVTKYIKGGDLLSYLNALDVDKLPESQA